MNIYTEIQKKFRAKVDRVCKDCWIADRKNALGFTTRPSANRGPDYPKYPCPPEYHKILDKLIRKYYS